MPVDRHYLRQLLSTATRGRYHAVEYPFPTMDDLVAAWSQALRNNPEGLTTYAVWLEDDQKLFVATTGNGPTSAANAAYFAALSPDVVASILNDLDRAERDRDAWRAEHDNLLAIYHDTVEKHAKSDVGVLLTELATAKLEIKALTAKLHALSGSVSDTEQDVNTKG